jgi:hypothetical protein
VDRGNRWHLGIDEVSGLGRRRHPDSGRPEVLAVGDREPVVVTLGVDDSGALLRDAGDQRAAARHRVTGLPDRLAGSGGHVDWEAVAGDATGRVVVLRESGSRLLVLSPTLRHERTLDLRWDPTAKASLESVLLLRDGHLLAATEYPPLRLLEFAAPGEPSLGLTPQAALGVDDRLQLPSGDELRCVASWAIAPDAGLDSVNDLAMTDSHLVVVSSRSRALVRLRLPRAGEDTLAGDGALALGEIAQGHDERAEGLLVDPDLGVLIGVDRGPGGHGADLYRLDPPW